MLYYNSLKKASAQKHMATTDDKDRFITALFYRAEGLHATVVTVTQQELECAALHKDSGELSHQDAALVAAAIDVLFDQPRGSMTVIGHRSSLGITDILSGIGNEFPFCMEPTQNALKKLCGRGLLLRAVGRARSRL
jgi:hypothetical protein